MNRAKPCMRRCWQCVLRSWGWFVWILVAIAALLGLWAFAGPEGTGVPERIAATATIVVLWVLGPVLYYYVWRKEKASARGVAVQTFVLAITLVGVLWYAWEAKKTAEATKELVCKSQQQVKETKELVSESQKQTEVLREQVEGELAGRAGLFVSTDIPSVEEYVKSKTGESIPDEWKRNWKAIDENWLVPKIANHGEMTAVNIGLYARWVPGSYEGSEERATMQYAPRRPSEMRSALDNLDKEVEKWRKKEKTVKAWTSPSLGEGESIVACLPAPEDDDAEDDRAVGLIWWGPGYLKWTSWIKLNPEKNGTWPTNWLLAKPRRGGYDCWPQTECGDLPATTLQKLKPCPKQPAAARAAR